MIENLTLPTNYKGTKIEIVVEDDAITTFKIFKDGECVICDDSVATSDGKDLAFTAKNYYALLNGIKEYVDNNYAVEVATTER